MGKPACLFAAESYYYGYYGSIQPDIGRSSLGGLSALFFPDQCTYVDFYHRIGYLFDAGA